MITTCKHRTGDERKGSREQCVARRQERADSTHQLDVAGTHAAQQIERKQYGTTDLVPPEKPMPIGPSLRAPTRPQGSVPAIETFGTRCRAGLAHRECQHYEYGPVRLAHVRWRRKSREHGTDLVSLIRG